MWFNAIFILFVQFQIEMFDSLIYLECFLFDVKSVLISTTITHSIDWKFVRIMANDDDDDKYEAIYHSCWKSVLKSIINFALNSILLRYIQKPNEYARRTFAIMPTAFKYKNREQEIPAKLNKTKLVTIYTYRTSIHTYNEFERQQKLSGLPRFWMNEAVKMLEAIYWAQIENRFSKRNFMRCLGPRRNCDCRT